MAAELRNCMYNLVEFCTDVDLYVVCVVLVSTSSSRTTSRALAVVLYLHKLMRHMSPTSSLQEIVGIQSAGINHAVADAQGMPAQSILFWP